jgi:murein DD-endopeptidase MepM/ murein hydrolase activator NlpD
LGIDIRSQEITIHAASDGKVHSFKNNEGLGNHVQQFYKHTIDDVDFYTLYGHLSKDKVFSNSRLIKLQKGDRIGYLVLPK